MRLPDDEAAAARASPMSAHLPLRQVDQELAQRRRYINTSSWWEGFYDDEDMDHKDQN
jgi:hypothetical protein